MQRAAPDISLIIGRAVRPRGYSDTGPKSNVPLGCQTRSESRSIFRAAVLLVSIGWLNAGHATASTETHALVIDARFRRLRYSELVMLKFDKKEPSEACTMVRLCGSAIPKSIS